MCQTKADKAGIEEHTRIWGISAHALAWTRSISLSGVVLAVPDLVQCTLLILHAVSQYVAGRGLMLTALGCIPMCDRTTTVYTKCQW